MREISPANDMTADEFLGAAPPPAQAIADAIRREKREGMRRRPSTALIDKSNVLTAQWRRDLLDAVAAKVDENLFGRSEMCAQFADLLQHALAQLDIKARAVVGQASYYVEGREVHSWAHAWVRIGDEVVDGNVDSLYENPLVPKGVSVAPYWGPIAETPRDRRLKERHGESLPPDADVSEVWWPELRDWIVARLRDQTCEPGREPG